MLEEEFLEEFKKSLKDCLKSLAYILTVLDKILDAETKTTFVNMQRTVMDELAKINERLRQLGEDYNK